MVSAGTMTRRSAVLLLGIAVCLAAGLPARAQSRLATFGQGELTIETAAGARHRFAIELAETAAQQAQGLMYRRKLAADAGMLFVYRNSGRLSMWMKNTFIPLDMIFIATDGRIAKIVQRTVPMSLATISSDESVRAVLELNGGTAARLQLAPGDRVLHEAFGTAP